MRQCPKCSSENIHRSRAKSQWEGWRKELTGKRPYRCRTCGWRGWGVEVGPKFADEEVERATRAITPESPNLKGTALARDEHRPADIDLHALDTLEPPGKKRK